MRAKSKWTPGGIVLWLIAAAVLATLIVCSESPREATPPAATDEVEIEVEVVE